MRRYIFIILGIILTINTFAQVAKQGEKFNSVPVIEEKVTFLKEVSLVESMSADGNYTLLKDWAIENYGKDPFLSSVRHDTKNKEFIAKSRIELLLPANKKGVREKMVMRYRINGFIFQDRCVLEVTDISYLYENSSKNKLLPRIIRAEDFITDNAINIDDEVKEYRENTRKSTLFFLNELGENFEKHFSNR
ncbi:DUF4468 domain-containing protein [Dysgonomonas sp. Marseille-P4361]|uniref:DUF4468 domain-containing protein n=1 Tax=Dysgonomonas sp. Marseille-P4361 TaxID=2161820 RepID=UPI000D54CE75|nr:DUF4468 domain-containing protein [Dysgonomonas sp. Marseille-P4361]